MNKITVYRDFEEWCLSFAQDKQFEVTINGGSMANAYIRQLIRMTDGYLLGTEDVCSGLISINKLEELSFSLPHPDKCSTPPEDTPSILDSQSMSDDNKWVRSMLEIGSRIHSYDKEKYPTLNSAFKEVLIELRNTYGVVLSQLQKEYKDKFGVERAPDPIVLISQDESYRTVFESLISDIAERYVHPELVPISSLSKKDIREEIMLLAWELGEKRADNSKGYNATFRLIYADMGCDWEKLREQHKIKRNSSKLPRKYDVLINDPVLCTKFRQSAYKMLTKHA